MRTKAQVIYSALKNKYRAHILEKRAILLIYFNDAVGVGEHATHIDDMDRLLGELAEAEDKLKALKMHFKDIEH